MGNEPRAHRLSRRSVLVSAGGVSLLVAFAGPRPALAVDPRAAQTEPTPGNPNAWVTIGTDDLVTIVSPQSEMGQGIMTALPLLIAEEMDADWQKVRVVQAPSDAKTYGNPDFGGLQLTGGSRSTPGFYNKLRLVGAQTRMVILASAAAALGVSLAELSTEPNRVVHAKSGRAMTYGEVAARASVPADLPVATAADLKQPAAWRYIGKDVPRFDIPAKVDGSAGFGIDVQRPGMLFGMVLRPSVQGESPATVDDAAAKAVEGVVKIVPLAYGVGVIAETFWAARQAKEALKVTWTTTAKARTYTSDQVLADYRAIAEDPAQAGVGSAQRGDATAALRGSAKVVAATYLVDHVHHATMEPLSATALVTPGQVEIWGPFQAQSAVQTAVAQVADVRPEKVSITTTMLGGAFGRKSEVDFPLDAVLLAKAVPGQPVKVIWTREDDVQNGKYRPLAAQAVQVGLDRGGQIVAWQHRTVAESIFARYSPPGFERAGGRDETVTKGTDLAYGVPNLRSEYIRAPRGVDVGFWRGVGPGYTKFAVECMLDEAAAAAGVDPLTMRLRMLSGAPRAQAVVRAAAGMAEWGRKRDGTALGIAYSEAFGSHCAQVAEIALDRTSGEIRVRNVWCAVDAGVAVQPGNIEAQVMGAIVHGVSQALYERITLNDGVVQEANFDSYRVIRMSETPAIQVQIMPSLDPPGGLGEVGLPPVGPAIANAFAALTGGRRLRQYPFLPERVLGALQA